MKTIRWDTVKRKVEETACGLGFIERAAPYALLMSLEPGRSMRWRDNAMILRNEFIRTVRNWDIRRAAVLISLFPGAVPRRYAGAIPSAMMDDKGEWVLVFQKEVTDG